MGLPLKESQNRVRWAGNVIVIDDIDDRRFLAEMVGRLGRNGYPVVLKDSYESAKKLHDRGGYDAVLRASEFDVLERYLVVA